MIKTYTQVTIRCDWVEPTNAEKGARPCYNTWQQLPSGIPDPVSYAQERSKANGWAEFYGRDLCPQHRETYLAESLEQ